VVAVLVRQEDVGDPDAVALDPLEQRLDHAVPVHEDTVAARAVRDEEGVREPARVFGALDDHRLGS
jgi:hypothetical protein